MSSMPLWVFEPPEPALSPSASADWPRRPATTLLPHEIGFFVLYALVASKLFISSGTAAWRELLVWIGLAGTSAMLVRLTTRLDTIWAWRVRLGAYVLLMNAAYFRLGAVAAATGAVGRDAPLQHIDTLLFGRPLPLYLDAAPQVGITELLSFCYFLLFPYILVSCGRQLVRYRRAPQEARAFFSGLFLIYALGFVGYLFVPARGPWLEMDAVFRHPIAGGWMTALNESVVVRGSNRVDAFPSLHVAVSAFILFFDRRFAPWRCRVYLPAAIGLWISTLYLRFHYGSDVLAGALLAIVALRVAFVTARQGAAIPGGEVS